MQLDKQIKIYDIELSSSGVDLVDYVIVNFQFRYKNLTSFVTITYFVDIRISTKLINNISELDTN